MKKPIKIALSYLCLLAAPFLGFSILVESTPDQYSHTYTSELRDKFVRLNSEKGKKIIFVGGSSIPFGVRSDLIEKELPDYKAIDFGLYATLGTKMMMELSECNIQSGDIVVLSPEVAQQTYSNYFNGLETLKATDGYYGNIWKRLSFDEQKQLLYNYFTFGFGKLNYYRNNNAPDPSGVYNHASFNEWGDVSYDRPVNIMLNEFDSNNLITVDGLLDADFLSYEAEYYKFVKSKGASLYFNFSPMNDLAIRSTEKECLDFQTDVTEKMASDGLLSNFSDCVIDSRYFYDTNYHLNNSGSLYYTNLLANNLKKKIADNSATEIVVPNPPTTTSSSSSIDEGSITTNVAFADYKGEDNIDFQKCFNYQLSGGSYKIVSAKEQYNSLDEIILPTVYNGKAVTSIAENALYGMINLKKVHIGLAFRSLEAKCFNGCIALTSVILYQTDSTLISPPTSGLFTGANRGVKLYIPKGSNYVSGYSWEPYFSYMVEY